MGTTMTQAELDSWDQRRRAEAAAAAPPAAIVALQGIPERLKTILLDYRREMLDTARQKFINFDGMKARNEASRVKALAAIDQAQQDAADAKATIEKATAAAFKLPTDVAAQTLATMKHEQCWRRLSAQLAAGVDPLDLIQKASAAGNLEDLQCLRVEMVCITSNSDQADAFKIMIDAAILPLLPDAQRAAQIRQDEVDKDIMPFVLMALNQARSEPSGQGPCTILAAPYKKVVRVTEELLDQISRAERDFLTRNDGRGIEPGVGAGR